MELKGSFTRALVGPYPETDQSSPHHPILYLKSILILSTHLRLGLPSGLFPSGFPANIPYAFLLPPFVLHVLPIIQQLRLTVFTFVFRISCMLSSNEEKARKVIGRTCRPWPFYSSFTDSLAFRLPTDAQETPGKLRRCFQFMQFKWTGLVIASLSLCWRILSEP
jgi:hypothetical protein